MCVVGEETRVRDAALLADTVCKLYATIYGFLFVTTCLSAHCVFLYGRFSEYCNLDEKSIYLGKLKMNAFAIVRQHQLVQILNISAHNLDACL